MEKEIKLSEKEISSGLSRVRYAEGLICQLPKDHEGRNSWLMNYGTEEEAQSIRDGDAFRLKQLGYSPRKLKWDKSTNCLCATEGS